MDELAEIRAIVRDVEARTDAARQRALTRQQASFVRPVRSDLGTVTVSGAGELLAVDLAPERLAVTTEASLGQDILAAVHAAEQEVERMRLPQTGHGD